MSFHSWLLISFLVLKNIPLSGWTTVHLSIHVLQGISVASRVWPLWLKLPWTPARGLCVDIISGWRFPCAHRKYRLRTPTCSRWKPMVFILQTVFFFFPPETRQEHMIILFVSLWCWMDFFFFFPVYLSPQGHWLSFHESYIYRMLCPAVVAQGLTFAPGGQ